MKTKKILYSLIFVNLFLKSDTFNDVNVAGFLRFANGLGRVTTVWTDILSKKLRVNFIESRKNLFLAKDLPNNVKNIAASKKIKSPLVSILTDVIWTPNVQPYKKVPNSIIKFAYSMCESTKIPQPWVAILNTGFDGVIVPDNYLIDVYKKSGVKIPIFMIPIACYLNDFLKLPIKNQKNHPFIFGVSAALSKNKNIELLIDAFFSEFGNNNDFLLKIHSPWNIYKNQILAKLNQYNATNIVIDTDEMSWQDYIKFMEKIDCYILLSKGEGFSITPREAMACGIPCILSNNSAHKTICNTGLVYPVKSEIEQPSDREFYFVDVGNNFNCHLQDVKNAMINVVNNYDAYLTKSQERRNWAKRYLHKNLADLYINIVRPKKVILGNRNQVTKKYIITDSKKLYKKYKKIIKYISS